MAIIRAKKVEDHLPGPFRILEMAPVSDFQVVFQLSCHIYSTMTLIVKIPGFALWDGEIALPRIQIRIPTVPTPPLFCTFPSFSLPQLVTLCPYPPFSQLCPSALPFLPHFAPTFLPSSLAAWPFANCHHLSRKIGTPLTPFGVCHYSPLTHFHFATAWVPVSGTA